MSKQPGPADSAKQARIEKKVARDAEGAKALSDYQADSVAIRKNMERLRALRLAREAAEAANPAPKPVKAVKAKAAAGKKTGAKKAILDPKEKAAQLSEWLARQKAGGHGT